MRESHQDNLFRVILSSIADGVFTVDDSRTVTSFNPAAERITGVPAAQAIGRKCYEVFHSDICESGCLLERTLRTGVEAIDTPVRILNSEGRRIPVSISTAVLRADSGDVLGAVETFRDLSAIEDLRKELEQRYSFEDIITKSPALLKIINILPDIAESGSTVLIQGPSGSGKELFAKAVHNLSARRAKPYVVINCGTLPPPLFESELFGYVRGAFTDAKSDKQGKLGGAEGGTVFFDEIGELPLQTQVKLLRLLQHHEYEPVGGVKVVKADIRVVAATNRDLRELVARGEFREDLYYRLAVIRFDLPELRDRREDVPILVDHFIRRFNALTGKNLLSVSPDYMETLLRHDFPGNVRELENIIEYGYAVCRGRALEVAHLPLEMKALWARLEKEHEELPGRNPWTASLPGDRPPPGKRAQSPVRVALEEETEIRRALEKTQGHRGRAAKLLDMDRSTLWRKMKRYGIEVVVE